MSKTPRADALRTTILATCAKTNGLDAMRWLLAVRTAEGWAESNSAKDMARLALDGFGAIRAMGAEDIAQELVANIAMFEDTNEDEDDTADEADALAAQIAEYAASHHVA